MTELWASPSSHERKRGDRRADIAEAAIAILGELGSRGLTHRAIDKRLHYPEGTTSAFFRRREDLVMAAVNALFEGDLSRMRPLFDTLLARDRVDIASVAQWFTDMVSAVRKQQSPTLALARYECFLIARRDPEADKLLRDSFAMRTERTAEIFNRLGAANPHRAATQFEVLIRGTFFTAAFVPDILDQSQLPDQGFFQRALESAMAAT